MIDLFNAEKKKSAMFFFIFKKWTVMFVIAISADEFGIRPTFPSEVQLLSFIENIGLTKLPLSNTLHFRVTDRQSILLLQIC
jgi:hypothetical protein